MTPLPPRVTKKEIGDLHAREAEQTLRAVEHYIQVVLQSQPDNRNARAFGAQGLMAKTWQLPVRPALTTPYMDEAVALDGGISPRGVTCRHLFVPPQIGDVTAHPARAIKSPAMIGTLQTVRLHRPGR